MEIRRCKEVEQIVKVLWLRRKPLTQYKRMPHRYINHWQLANERVFVEVADMVLVVVHKFPLVGLPGVRVPGGSALASLYGILAARRGELEHQPLRLSRR